MTLSYWSWTRARVTIDLGWTCCSWNRGLGTVIRLKCFFVFVVDRFLGPSDPSMMRVEILGDFFLFMAIGTIVAKVTILSGKLETR